MVCNKAGRQKGNKIMKNSVRMNTRSDAQVAVAFIGNSSATVGGGMFPVYVCPAPPEQILFTGTLQELLSSESLGCVSFEEGVMNAGFDQHPSGQIAIRLATVSN